MEIIKKEVKLIELFYDLLYVYAISKLTSLISQPVGGTIPPYNFFAYLITSFVILQGWLYFTNYVNRYGKWVWYEYILAGINMIAVIFMSNTISTNWNVMAFPFNISMLIMLLMVLILYSIQAYKEKTLDCAAGNSITILLIVCAIYVAALIAHFLNLTSYVIWLNVVAIITGAFLPFFIKGKFDKGIINFPHLVERFELLTIITFGEAVVGMAHFFDVNDLSIIPILVFLTVISMFGFYVIQIHELMEHMRSERSLRLMFSHYFIVISINLVTVAFELMHSGGSNYLLVSVLTMISLMVFYISTIANKEYYRENVELSKNDLIKMALVTFVGSLVMLIFTNRIWGFYLGVLIVTLGNLMVILQRYMKFKHGQIIR